MGLKRRKVVFGPSGGWGIVPLTQSHSPYLHDKSWSQEEPQAPGCGGFFFFFSFIHFFTNITSPSSEASGKNDGRHLDLVLHPPWKTGQGIASVPVTWRPQEWGGGRVFNVPLPALSFCSPAARVKCLHCTLPQTTDTLNLMFHAYFMPVLSTFVRRMSNYAQIACTVHQLTSVSGGAGVMVVATEMAAKWKAADRNSISTFVSGKPLPRWLPSETPHGTWVPTEIPLFKTAFKCLSERNHWRFCSWVNPLDTQNCSSFYAT